MVEERGDIKVLMGELIKRANDSDRRLRNLELRTDRSESSLLTLEQTLLTSLNELKINFEKISLKLTLLSEKIAAVEVELGKVTKELEKKAGKQDLKEIQSYIDLVSPVTAKFVTREELDRALEDEFARKA